MRGYGSNGSRPPGNRTPIGVKPPMGVEFPFRGLSPSGGGPGCPTDEPRITPDGPISKLPNLTGRKREKVTAHPFERRQWGGTLCRN